MEPIYADYAISMTEFKKNPARVLRDAGARPVTVLNHNRPAFYMIPPEVHAGGARRMACTGWRRKESIA